MLKGEMQTLSRSAYSQIASEMYPQHSDCGFLSPDSLCLRSACLCARCIANLEAPSALEDPGFDAAAMELGLLAKPSGSIPESRCNLGRCA